MRKYIIAFLIVAAGLVLIFNGLSRRSNKNVYAENAFAEHAGDFDTLFNGFKGSVEKDLIRIKDFCSDTLRVRDTLINREFFLKLLDDTEELTTIVFFQERFKVVAQRDGPSLIYAVDSTSRMDVVRWRRFENMKQISSWNESFEQEVEKSYWYKKLLNLNNQFTWFSINEDPDISPEELDSESIYAGYSFLANDSKSIIVLKFSKERLMKVFGSKVRNLSPLLRMKTADGRTLELSASSSMSKSYKDSLDIAITNHFQRFDTLKTGTFNFSFKNEIYWNSFRKFKNESGLSYYLFTVNNKDLSSYSAASESRLYLWIGAVLIFLGLVILAIRKRFFYSLNRMEIPSLSDLLEDDENRYLEFKSSLRWDQRQGKVNPELEKVILKTLSAFGNTDGGILLIGVDDNKNIVGLENDIQSLKKKDTDYFEVHLRNVLHRAMGVKYVSRHIRTEFETLGDGKVVCKIKVATGDEPVFLKFKDKNGNVDEKFFVRSGNSSHEIESIPEINDYINKKFKK